MSGLTVYRWLFPFLCAVCGAAFGAVPTPPDENSLRLDQVAQGLKDETLQLNRDLLALEDPLLFPNRSRTTVYVAVKISGFMLSDISVSVDGAEPLRYRYSDSEQRAFLRKGYHRLTRLPLTPGAHKLRAEFTGRFFDAPKQEPSVRGRLETVFEKGAAELDLVLPISRNSRLDRPGLPEVARLEARKKRENRAVWLPEPETVEADDGSYEPGGENDPRYRSALFLRWDNRYFSALLDLQAVLAGVKDSTRLPPDFWWLMGDCYLYFGMEKPAEEIYRRLAADGDPETVARARLRLADFEYQRGYYDQATATLRRVRERLPATVLPEWQQALVKVLLAQGRYNEAVEVLTDVKDVETLPLHMRYNLGIALINDGKIAQGRHVLDRAGVSTPEDAEMLNIRDKANLTLAYHFLQSQQGATARPIFERVRVDGAFSNRALLGMGWAELTPRGAKQERAPLSEPAPNGNSGSLGTALRPGYLDSSIARRLAANRPFRQAKTAKEEAEQLRRALVPWLELVKRDPMDAAVQEGLLAIPYAFDRLGDREQALGFYTRAIETLEEARKRLSAAQLAIQQGRMVETIVRRDLDAENGWMWRLRDLPDTPETYYLQALLAEHRFQEALKNYRDVRFLGRNLDGWRPRLNGIALQYAKVDRPSIAPEALFEAALDGWEAPWGPLQVALRADTALAPPGAYDAPFDLPNPWWVELAAAGIPARFDGVAERLPWLRSRFDGLRPLVADAGSRLSRNLQAIALQELDGQIKTVDRYLVEARFAVARQYDRALREGAAAPDEAKEQPDAAR